MMRSIIIGLSVIFFSLSAIVTYKALKLPVSVYGTSYQDSRSEIISIPVPPMPESDNNAFNYSTEDQDSNKVLVEGAEETITQLENQLAATKDALEEIKTVNPEIQSRTVAVFSGKTFLSGQDIFQDVTYAHPFQEASFL